MPFGNLLNSFRRAGVPANTGINPRASGGMPELMNPTSSPPPPGNEGMLSSLLPQVGARGKIGASNPLAAPPPGTTPQPNNNPYQPWFMTGPSGPTRTPAPTPGGGGMGGGMGRGLRAFNPGMGRMRRRLG